MHALTFVAPGQVEWRDIAAPALLWAGARIVSLLFCSMAIEGMNAN